MNTNDAGILKTGFVTNYDVQGMLNDESKMEAFVEELVGIKPGHGSIEIHVYALKQLVNEIQWLRWYLKKTKEELCIR